MKRWGNAMKLFKFDSSRVALLASLLVAGVVLQACGM
jgi:hypothetical protein